MISSFYKKPVNHSAVEIADALSCKIVGNRSTYVNNIATLKNAQFNEISFFGNVKYIDDFKKTKAGMMIMEEKYLDILPCGITAILSDNVMLSYAKLVAKMFPEPNIKEAKIAGSAIISKLSKLGSRVQIGNCAVIESGAVIGNNCVIGDFVHIGNNVVIGNNCKISSHVSIDYTIVGDRVSIHAGAKIGQPGFSVIRNNDEMVHIKQLGRVIIGNDVRIGANTTIDKGAIEDTIIGDGTAIDNLVQIAHNVQVGKMVIIVSQVGIAGSTLIGDEATLAGQVGVVGHISIGKRAVVGAKSGVISSIDDGAVVAGMPAIDIMTWKKQAVYLKRLVKKEDNS